MIESSLINDFLETKGAFHLMNGLAFSWNSVKEDNLERYNETVGNFIPGISVPFEFSRRETFPGNVRTICP